MLLAEVRWASRVWVLPFLSALAPSERYATEAGQRHKSLTEWAWQLLALVRRWYPEREIVAVADSTYASLRLLKRCRKLSNPITFITRLRLDAVLYEPAPPRYGGQLGRPRLKGDRLANLSVVAENPEAEWEPITISGWYAAQQRTVEVISATAVWYSTGLPAVPLRWVLIRDPKGEFETQALLCTKLDKRRGGGGRSALRTTPEALRRRFASQEQQLSIAIEAGTHSPWVSPLLEGCGHEVPVAKARKLSLIYAIKRKTDEIDALRT